MLLKMYLIIFIKICILMEIVLSKDKKLPYQLAQIGENYMDYKKKYLPADEVKMTIRDFYNTLYNVQFFQLPYIGLYNYDNYMKRTIHFCTNIYETYPVFIVNNTINEFVTHLNDLVTNIERMNLKEIMSDGDANTNPKSCHNILVKCFKLWGNQIYQSNPKYLNNSFNCVETTLFKSGKLVEFQKHIKRFKNSIREISLIKNDGGLTFNSYMLPILRFFLVNGYKPFNEKEAKEFYIEYLGVDMKMKESKIKCIEVYKVLDKNTYTSIKIGYHIFPAKNDTTFEIFKLRRINFIFHLRALFKDMGIPNDRLFNSLQNASKSIDKSYYDSVVNTRVMANESYESYIIRMKVKEYYPLPKKLWKLDVANIPNGHIQNN